MGTELVPCIGMPFVPLEAVIGGMTTIEVDGEEAFDQDCRCVGWE